MFWTEDGIRKVARKETSNVLAGDEGRREMRKHVQALLTEQATAQLGEEMRSTAEQLAERTKASLHRRLNAIHAAHVERLSTQLARSERDLEERSPTYRRELETLESRLRQVATASEGWLDEPLQQLQQLAKMQQEEFATELERLRESFEELAREEFSGIKERFRAFVEARLHRTMVETVREYVRSAPFNRDGLSNRQLAAAKGISLRAAKRLRRAGQA